MIEDEGQAAARMLSFLETGLMPTVGGPAIPLVAHSVSVHGDSDGAVAMARYLRGSLEAAGIKLTPFLPSRP